MDPKEFHRYTRQIQLPGFGLQGQNRLKQASVVIIGLGGLGLPVAQILNGMGVGRLILVDGDKVELHNLHRQSLYRERDVGQLKVKVAKQLLKERNQYSSIEVWQRYLDKETALSLFNHHDVVVDCTDNFAARYLINDACVLQNKPFVHASLQGFQGQLSVFNYRNGPSYRCLFPNPPATGEIPSCDTYGILGAMPFWLGSAQALEVVKVICDLPGVLSGKLLIFDALSHRQTHMNFSATAQKAISEMQEEYGDDQRCSASPSMEWDHFLSLSKEDKANFVLVDIREETERSSPAIAEERPWSKIQQETLSWDEKKNYVLFCQSGKRSAMAVHHLSRLHPSTHFISMEGGLLALTEPDQIGL